jgi:hypothetical protein
MACARRCLSGLGIVLGISGCHELFALDGVRLKQSGTTMLFESSDDGTDWMTMHTIASMPFDVTGAQVAIFAGTFTSVADPGRARLDTFRMECP